MNIEGPIPFSVAQAYGAQRVTNVAKAVVAQPVQQIVAGQVAGKVHFDGIDVSNAQPCSCTHVLQIASKQRLELQPDNT